MEVQVTPAGYRIEKDGQSVDLTADEMRALVMAMFSRLRELLAKP